MKKEEEKLDECGTVLTSSKIGLTVCWEVSRTLGIEFSFLGDVKRLGSSACNQRKAVDFSCLKEKIYQSVYK